MNFLQRFFNSSENRLLGGVYGNLTEILKVLHQVKGSLTCTGTSGLVTFDYLSLGVLYELGEFGIDFFNKLFHVTISLFWFVND